MMMMNVVLLGPALTPERPILSKTLHAGLWLGNSVEHIR